MLSVVQHNHQPLSSCNSHFHWSISTDLFLQQLNSCGTWLDAKSDPIKWKVKNKAVLADIHWRGTIALKDNTVACFSRIMASAFLLNAGPISKFVDHVNHLDPKWFESRVHVEQFWSFTLSLKKTKLKFPVVFVVGHKQKLESHCVNKVTQRKRGCIFLPTSNWIKVYFGFDNSMNNILRLSRRVCVL